MAGANTPPHGDAQIGPEETDALVIMCSDRQFRRPTEHFLSTALGLANYDLVAVPGGVYMLSFADALPKQLKVGTQMVKFLMKNHVPPRIVLVAHEGCARYQQGFATWLRRENFSLRDKQIGDLHSVRTALGEMFPKARADAYYAQVLNERDVSFLPV